jgi:hypothetical protein
MTYLGVFCAYQQKRNAPMIGFLALAMRIPSASIRKAPKIVDFPELLGPTKTLKLSSVTQKSLKALNFLALPTNLWVN